MAHRAYEFNFGRVLWTVKVANELWYNNLKNGDRHYHLFNFGIYEHATTKHRIMTLTLLWLSTQFVYVTR